MDKYTLKNTYRPWIALFSQSGKEICDLAEHFGRWPDLIVTNNLHSFRWDRRLYELAYIPNGPFQFLSIHDVLTTKYYEAFNYWSCKPQFQSPLITLHGWLKIVPAQICNEYEIYNGHPGLIHPDYSPELAGKDPQQRVWHNMEKYKVIGSVVHRVTPVVDGGKIMTFSAVNNECKTEQEVFDKLRETSFKAWIDFLGTVL